MWCEDSEDYVSDKRRQFQSLLHTLRANQQQLVNPNLLSDVPEKVIVKQEEKTYFQLEAKSTTKKYSYRTTEEFSYQQIYTPVLGIKHLY